MADRNNLIVNPSFKTNTTGWSATGSSTIARITNEYFYGSSCLEVTKAAASNSGVITTDRILVTASLSYALGVYVKIPAAAETGTLSADVLWYDSATAGSLLSTSNSVQLEVIGGDDWVRLTGVFTAPSGALSALVRIIQPTAGTAGEKFLVDAVLFEQSSYLNEYVDEPTQAQENEKVTQAFRPVPYPKITGLFLKADVSIGSLVLNTIDEDGVVWICTDIEGWWTHPEPDVRDIPRGWGDGSYDVRGRYQARQLTLNGVFLPPDPSYVASARNKLITNTDLVYVGDWLKTNESPTKASYVRLSGRPEINTVNERGKTEFSIGLRAPDPLKYEWFAGDEFGYRSTTISEGSQATITNTGNAYAPVILSVAGPLTGPATIANETTNESITIIEAVASGEILEIDTLEHEVALDGDAVGKRNLIDVLAEWILLAPGDNVITFDDDGGGTPTLTVYYRSAWLG